MPDRRFSAARRVALTFAVLLAAALPLVGFLTYQAARSAVTDELDSRIRQEMATLLEAERHEGRRALIGDIEGRDAAVDAEGGYLLSSAAGDRLAGRLQTGHPLTGWHNLRFIGDHGELVAGRELSTRLRDGTLLSVIEESGSVLRIETLLVSILAVAFGLILVIGVGGGLAFGEIIHRRLSRLDATATAIIAGDLARRMPVSARGDEFDRLSITLNRMLDRLELVMDNLRHVSADIAHDLRTPLARLFSGLEAARDGTPEVLHAAMERALAQAEDMLGLFATILRISELEASTSPHWLSAVDLDELGTALAETYEPVAAESGHRLIADLQPAATRGDRALLAQALSNLLDNALKYAPGQSAIVLASGQDEQMRPFIEVRDAGPGIPREGLATALRRFGRLDASRGSPGHGLGLNLVAAIAAWHRGVLDFADQGPGLAVRLTFEAAKAG